MRGPHRGQKAKLRFSLGGRDRKGVVDHGDGAKHNQRDDDHGQRGKGQIGIVAGKAAVIGEKAGVIVGMLFGYAQGLRQTRNQMIGVGRVRQGKIGIDGGILRKGGRI